MNSVIFKLLPYSESGIITRRENDTLIISGFRSDVDLEALQAELEAEWLELAKEEAAIQIKNALTAAQESRRPANFSDLTVKLQLGRITPAEREQLTAYYDALDALEREAKALQTAIAQVESVGALNDIAWPEWVGWEPLPLRFELLAEPEPAEPEDEP
jgi:hypothetical protein